MTAVLRTVGQVAGTVAAFAAFIPGGQAVAVVAGVVSTAANIGAELTAKGPVTRGQINERIIGANNPQPYGMGRFYSGGVQVHDVGYGGEVNDVQNPYRFIATVHSCAGPVDGFESLEADYTTVPLSSGAATGYYADWLWCDYKLGDRPDTALSPHYASTPGWGTDYKLSGFASMGLTLRWDKDGERFAGGQLPSFGAIWRGVKVYDPRLDDTYPGGSGSCRLGDESTYVYSTDPALHAGTYAYGRYVNGEKVFGIDLGETAIEWADIVGWANSNDARSWALGGVIYEPGDKWNNLKLIGQAGAAKPVLTGGKLHFHYLTPRTSLLDIGRDDLAQGPLRGGRTKGWKERHNTIVPRYRSEAQQWNYVQSDAQSVGAFVTADGEEKSDEVRYDLVTDKDQAAQLATYEIYERREKGPYVLTCKPHMRNLQVGACVTILAEVGLEATDTKVIIRRKRMDLVAGTVTFTLEAETDAKHTDALASTGTAPTGGYLPDPTDFDTTYKGNNTDPGVAPAVTTSGTIPVTATDTEIEITSFTGYVLGAYTIFPADTITGLTAETEYAVLYDRSALTYIVEETPATTALADSDNVFLVFITTLATP